ncbi:heterodisulfide reductase [Candidatus Methanocrinis natronophilus]|uniref:Heterodisulfide reductase n=1 Tax=Candidatus Methanocrinis natronophilus TaxID=3033396 RepID=A0ABT5X8M8_9EURY|nr:heterodisulfide reductase [Candidatus Methanocrinis natronophilus]MDF0590937.1 heterodisulfide reductase [Candidatus Methanocrinis natronophilus]
MADFYTYGLTYWRVIALTALVVGVWIYGLYFMFKKWGMGSTGYQDELRYSFWLFIATWIHEAFKGGVWVFVKTLVLDVLLLRRTLRRSPVRWVMHMTIFYGFVTLATLSGVGLLLDTIIHFNILGYAPAAEEVFVLMKMPFNIFGYILLIGSTIGVTRRIIFREVRARTSAYDVVLLGGVFLITVTGFYAQWLRGDSFLVGNVFAYPIYAPYFALVHTILALALFAIILPWSKYQHVIAAPLTILANRGGE